MKINVEVDITPEELRRFMGLPDVQEWQQQMIESFSENIASSQEQQQEFVRNMLTGSFAPWQNMFTLMTGGIPAKNKD
ncbi:MAG: DUF6489 family protein [Pseudomonadota bacterium]